MKSRLLAMTAGCLGAVASATGKLGMSGVHVTNFCAGVTEFFFKTMNASDELALTEEEIFITSSAVVVLRGMLLMATVMLNAIMWTLFIQSMQELNSGEAAVLNTGTNIVTSAFLGVLFFGETLGTMWWVGASFIIAGIAVLQTPNNDSFDKDITIEKKKKS